jgi:RNA polymerase sigma factor (sigma-70 family)
MDAIETTKTSSESELVFMAQQGDDKAMSMLISKYRPFVLGITKRMLVTDPEDIVHDVLIKVLLNLRQFELRSSFTTWLYRITMNQIFKHKRKKRMLPLEMAGEIEERVDSPDLLPGEAVMKNYFVGMLLCLDEEQRSSVILSDLFKMDHVKASGTLGISPDNFRKRLSRSRKDMKHWTEKKCSLVFPGKECKCNQKAKYFMAQGWIDHETKRFSESRVGEVSKYVQALFESE